MFQDDAFCWDKMIRKFGEREFNKIPEENQPLDPDDRKKLIKDLGDKVYSKMYHPKTKDDLSFEKKVYEWRSKLGEILVAPFNRKSWSKM